MKHSIAITIKGVAYEFRAYRHRMLPRFLGEGFLVGRDINAMRNLFGITDPKVIVDVGANVGLYSVGYAFRWPNCKIFAVEPVAQNLELLRFNTQYFPNVEVLPYAVSSMSGFTTMEMPTAEQLYEHKYVDRRIDYAIMSIHGKSGRHRQQVEAKTLDDIIGNDHIDYIKADTEGHEYHVIKGAHNILTNQRPCVQLELLEESQKMAGHTPLEVVLEMAQYRYTRLASSKNDSFFMPAP